jgi:two-component sensor histidine kinase
VTAAAALFDPPRNAEIGPVCAALEAEAAAFGGEARGVYVECEPGLRLDEPALGAVRAVTREAIANALAYAFPPGREGRIWVKLARVEGRIRLTVRDNGIGIPDLDAPTGRGHALIHGLAARLDGYARLGSAPFGGGLVTLLFPEPKA